MANANCLDNEANFKLCPFRVLKAEHPPMLRGQGATVTEQFYECLGEKCVAYHVGICLRLSDAVDNLYKRKV